MSRRSSLHAFHARTSAVFHEEGGWSVPRHFGNPLGEYEAAVDKVSRFDLGHHARIEVSGPDAAIFLHNLCTNDIKGLPAGGGCEAFLCTNKARVVAHVLVTRFPDTDDGRPIFRLDAVAGQADRILEHLNRYLISEQVELSDVTSTWAQILVAGPQAAPVLESVPASGGVDPRRLTPAAGASPAARSQPFVRRRGGLSVPAFDLWCPASAAEEYWNELALLNVPPAGTEVLDILRLEAGTPRYGVDIDDQRFVAEVGRTEEAISYTKGCYLGQEPIVMARDRGHVNRLLLGLAAEDQGEPLVAGAKVFEGETEVGQVTSSVFSPRLGKVIALAYLKRGVWTPGTSAAVFPPSTGRPVTVCSLPYIKPLD